MKDEENKKNKDHKDSQHDDAITPYGDKKWKLPEDDDIDADEVFERPIIPGTSGVES